MILLRNAPSGRFRFCSVRLMDTLQSSCQEWTDWPSGFYEIALHALSGLDDDESPSSLPDDALMPALLLESLHGASRTPLKLFCFE